MMQTYNVSHCRGTHKINQGFPLAGDLGPGVALFRRCVTCQGAPCHVVGLQFFHPPVEESRLSEGGAGQVKGGAAHCAAGSIVGGHPTLLGTVYGNIVNTVQKLIKI